MTRPLPREQRRSHHQAAREDSQLLSVPYRIGWEIRRVILGIFGPAQLTGDDDPLERLHHEREERVAAAKAASKSR